MRTSFALVVSLGLLAVGCPGTGGNGDAGLQRERNAVARRQGRVRGDSKALAGAARCEHGVDRTYELNLAVGTEREHSRALAPLDEQFNCEPALAHFDVGASDRGHQRPLNFGSRRIATGVHDAGN